ncbi:MAG: sugar ABC transporter permease [Eubacteriales bacterium]|nr:sugar ABC transporter permease [Eubacteriales bacterium]
MAPYYFIMPFFIGYLLFSVFPFAFSFFISFTDWNGVGASAFVGLSNYIRIFTQDAAAQKAFMNTFLFLVIAIPIEIILGLLTAMIIKDFVPKAKGALQLLNFLPYLTAPVAVGLIFQFLFDWDYGTVNQILTQIGASNNHIYWLGTEGYARFVVILVIVWRMFGYSMIILSAGLSTISPDLYEAAELDGANWFQKQIRITLPLLKPILGFVCVISLINGFQLFDDPYMLFASQAGQPYGGPGNSVLTVMMHMFQASFMNFQMGYGASIAYTLFFIIFILSMILTKFMKQEDDI